MKLRFVLIPLILSWALTHATKYANADEPTQASSLTARERTPEEYEKEDQMRQKIAEQNARPRKMIGAILRGMGEGSRRRTIHCVSRKIGNTTYTDCE